MNKKEYNNIVLIGLVVCVLLAIILGILISQLGDRMGKKLELNEEIKDGIYTLDNAIVRVENGELHRIDNGNWKKIRELS